MKRALGDRFKFASYENWVIYSESDEALTQFELRKSGKLKSISTVLDRRSRDLFDRSDLAAYVNARQLRKVYRAELDRAKQQVHALIEQIGKTASGVPAQGIDVQSVFRIYGDLANGGFQLAEDADGFTAGLIVGEKQVDLETCLVVAPSTPSAQFLASNEPAGMKTLGVCRPTRSCIWPGGRPGGDDPLGGQVPNNHGPGNEDFKKAAANSYKAMEQLKIAGIYGTFRWATRTKGCCASPRSPMSIIRKSCGRRPWA